MARNRVLSFMSQFSNRDSSRSAPPSPTTATTQFTQKQDAYRQQSPPVQQHYPAESSESHQRAYTPQQQQRPQGERVISRPMSMVQTYQPPLMDVTQDTLPELQPIFTFLNSHGNKLYQEGYFLKLDDQNSHGRPNVDRTWTECFAQLVGTILSLWDAAELDAAGQEGEVLPKFINLTDASIKMIEALPTRSNDDQPLQNVLSISTAGKNRYLLHFNSHHSLVQWTAGIRLAMYEHATLQEAYTGALIAGKGKALNSIGIIMERSKVKTEDWVRVRFGAGTPWRRCWCVISPPDEKEFQKLQKEMNKKKSAYDRSRPPILKGDVKFYDTKKTKKARPIASITDAFSAYAIYPQSKPLIDASTLIKVEGTIMIHSDPPTSTEGFVFVMPEVHPAVSGFEMMLRWLLPVYDTFGLYGRPGRLVADTLDPRSLMFAMPKERRYGYLEILDVSGLISTNNSQSWREQEWRKRMKELTAKRMTAISNGSRSGSRYSTRKMNRNSVGPSIRRGEFNDGASIRSTPSITWGQAPSADSPFGGVPRTDSAPAMGTAFQPPVGSVAHAHHRSISESQGLDRFSNQDTRYDGGYESGPLPPSQNAAYGTPRQSSNLRRHDDLPDTPERTSFEDEQTGGTRTPVRELQDMQASTSVQPVATPPAFAHAPGTLPPSQPYHSPELRRANSRMSQATLSQMAGAGGIAASAGINAYSAGSPRISEDQRRENIGRPAEERGVLSNTPNDNTSGTNANQNILTEGLVAAKANRPSFESPTPPPPPPHLVDTQKYISERNNPQENFNLNPSSSQYPGPAPILDSQSRSHLLSPKTNTSQIPSRPYSSEHQVAPSPYQQGHINTSSIDSTSSNISRNTARQSIIRKPLPSRTSSEIKNADSPNSATSSSTMGTHLIDQEGFDRIVPPPQHNNSEMHRQNSAVSSVYDDAASTESQEYVTARHSTETRGSIEKPRAGVMRTVGNSEQHYNVSPPQTRENIPNIDFGPTINYARNNIPRDLSPARQPAFNMPPRDPSPARKPALNVPPSPSYQPRTPSRTPEPGQYRPDPNMSPGGRTLAWQPGMTAVGTNQPSRRALTPEQFVQQRAAATPLYAHQRQPSSNTLGGRSNTPTPPLSRNRSFEYLAHSRNNSGDAQQRPSSRGTAAALGPSGSGDLSANVSAREREHLARVTGAPLVNVPNGNRSNAPNAGLVGAIDAREREKREMKQGLNSQAVQQAITQRQREAQYQQAQGQYQGTRQQPGQYAAPQQGYNQAASPQPYGQQQQQYPPQNQQQQQPWGQPSPQGYPQSGRPWTPTQQQRGPTSEQQQYFPPQQYPQQQQQQQQGRGRGPQNFQGQAF